MAESLINIEALAALSYLEIAAGRKDKIAEDIGEILLYVERIRALDLSDEPDPREVQTPSDMREDIVGNHSEVECERIVENFPSVSSDGLLEAHAALGRDL
ncbi:hypothetical protein A3C17_02470 [Candidatus Uhrbacteria bacterium RIFCSPHIGHO2_02_FULL_53_13]|uniref:Aspartyl/glutamyl-tRNA(Asn/Gln) amidotransferase subunit C n=2 Tax=Candidatus Uhriibacteriota TaxID=1752732 RepID=A0A1F7U089_9BACT|nr:MAG: hypothetical protein A3C17_02470 [Candidatus Uhrbacteria bacterium RIFCSPHIGHO2_02_FULL_53_13]OGL88815.1 MAG: hypothetical protein A3I45_03525 [Candidatus Uhrbacteria bacterium RIFCSPLOWO2_02_FULL_53_10]